MFQNNPEEFITKVSRLINEQKATMIVEHISYDTIEGEYDSTIFTAEKNTQSFEKAFLAKKAIQDYVFTDGVAEKSIERKFAEDLDAAEEVCVYAKLPRTFQIPTPVGNYSPDWAIAFYEGKVKHIFFVAETKGTMESLELRPIEQAKISCAKKLFNEMSTSRVNDTGEETFGLLCFAEITEFAKELHSEMEKVVLMDELPENWTYPLIQPKLIEKYLQVKIIL